MAPAWLWLQIFLSDPARAHLSPGHAARLGRGLTPGSMKACVVHSSRIQTPHSTSPSILYNPNPFTACLLNEVTLGSPPYGVPSSGQCLQHLLPFHIHRDPSQDPREKAGNNSGGLTGKGRVKPIIPPNPSISVLFMHLSFHTQPFPPGRVCLLQTLCLIAL